MREPSEILQELADESRDEGQSLEEWLEYLTTLASEVAVWVRMTENDIDKSKP